MTTVEKIVEIIGDYREEDIGFAYQTKIDYEHVTTWLNQFDEADRDFLMEEFLHLLPNSYYKKKNLSGLMAIGFEKISKDLGYEDIHEFFDETKFLSCNQTGNSQKIFLILIEEVLQKKYNRSIASCGTKMVKNWFYTDDILASGGIFYNDIESEISKFKIDNFIKNDIKIITCHVILHEWGFRNWIITGERGQLISCSWARLYHLQLGHTLDL